ncbi:MAG: caspase domain-containing protein, partial [Cyanobium sp.]
MKNGLTVGVVVGLLAVAAAAAQVQGSLAAVASPSRRPPVLLAQSPQVATRRLALVIGNKDYKNGVLSNSLNDAEDVSRVLRAIGFEVTLVKNANIEAMEAAAENFSRDIRRGDVVLFYFSGHGLEAGGQSYLIPLGLDDLTELKLKRQAFELNDLVETIEATDASARVFILDACRSELPRGWRTNNRSFFNRGLAIPPETKGTVIFYATKAGMFAADSLTGSRNSPFTTFLLRHLPTPNLEIQELICRTTLDVYTATREKQYPAQYGTLMYSLFLHPVPDASPQPVVNASADRPALPARAKTDSLTQAPPPAATPPTTATLPSPWA